VTDANFVESWTDDRGENWAVFGMLDPTCSYVSMIVEDSGCGMELGLLQNIFTPFFTTKGKTHGTGLGLAVVQGIVLAHVGAMVVQSRPGKGTRIKVILPLQKEEALSRSRKRRLIQAPTPEAERRTAAPQSNSGTKVLLVDDDPDFGDMLLTALERRGFEVAPCTSPVEALEEFLQNQRAWDVVVTDQTMPEMEGLELIRAIRKVNPNMPCILCTGFAETQVSLDVLNDSGAFALLRKPIDIDALTEAIRAALKDKAVTSP